MNFFLKLSGLFMIQAMLAPAVMAQQFGMDEQYQQNIQSNNMQGYAQNSTADGNTQAYDTDESAWQDMDYVQNQYAPLGNNQAPIQNSQYGAISTYKGTSGDWRKGKMQSGQQLPRTQAGLQAMRGGYTRPAAGWAGTNGFYNIGGGSRKYPLLPPTATSSVLLNTAF